MRMRLYRILRLLDVCLPVTNMEMQSIAVQEIKIVLMIVDPRDIQNLSKRCVPMRIPTHTMMQPVHLLLLLVPNGVTKLYFVQVIPFSGEY